VTYTPVLPAPGQYEVQMWWPASTEFCANVPVDIVHSGATDTVYINQQANGGKWNSLGTYEFTGDGTEYVKIRTDDGAGGTLSGTIVADAVRFIEPQPPPEPLTLIDNAIADVNSNNSDSPGVTHQSFWSSSTSRAGYHGSNYWTDGNSNKGVRSVTYTPVLPAPGRYMVQMWWPAYATNFATNVPVDIRHNGGTSTVLVNQRTGGAMWFTAGIFEFAGTGDEWLRIRTDGTDGFVIADAVRFVALDEQGPFVMAFDELSAAAGAGYSSSCRRPFGAGLYDSVSNKTYVCWNGPGMDILVRAYDHDAGAWGAPVLVCDLNYTARYVYHNYPVMRLAPDGRLVIYFCDHSNKLFQAKAPAPNSIEGAWARTEISADLTAYPMPVVAGNDIYVFYSKNNDINWPYRAYRYIKSTDNGATWSAPFTIIDSEKNDPQKYDEVYAWGVDYDPDAGRIGITWTMAGGPAHNSSDKNLYFAWLNLATGAMLNAAGASQGPIVNNSDLPDCLVVAATGDPTAASWGKQHPFTNPTPVRDLLTGNPIIAYGFHDAGAAKDSIRCARWDGAAWADSLVQLNAKAFGDLRNHGDGEIHAIYQTGNSILVKVSQDRGATWEQVSAGAIPFAGQDDKAGELTFIENGRPDAFAFLGTYFEDATKPELGGNNYDGIFHTYIVKEDTSDASAPVFLLHPDAGDGVGGGSRLDLTATASGNPVPSYQWQVKEGDSASWRDLTAADTNYGGINTDTLTIWYVGVFMNGWQHRVTASNTAAGAVYSDATTIVVLALPSFDENPVAAQAVAGGKSVDIHAIVSSDTPLTLQWQVKEGAAAAWRDLTAADTACTGIDTATLTLLAVATGMDGWQYRLVATNALGENHTVGTTLNVMPAHFAAPVALVFGSAGNLYVSDAQNNRIHQITPVQKADIFAGSGLAGLVDGIGFAASFSAPRGLAVLSGTLLVADSGNAVLRAINADGNVTTLLGAGAGFASPAGVAVDAAGNIYIADEASHVIRVVTSGSAGLNVGICAGLPGEEGLVDGTGTGARFRSPSALALGADGNLYVADTGNDAVRIVMPLSATTGVVDTLA
ncbi:MAG: BNR-4 repeat-containing protein, partial [Opitutaceae bacterium]|nr:BNR-4 repeat-containing protein [Opitutaceae bacterium]